MLGSQLISCNSRHLLRRLHPPARHPRRRYRTQCAVSGVCSVVLVLLLLMQLGTLLSVWDHLHPRWPYFPLVFCQCVNLAAVLAMQVRGTGRSRRIFPHAACRGVPSLTQQCMWVSSC